MVAKIEKDMEINPLRYVDPYSTIKSIKIAKEKNVCSYRDVYDYFCYSEFDFNKVNDLTIHYSHTECGLWLLNLSNAPEFIAKCYGKPAPFEDSYEAELFWEKIYEKIEDFENPDFKERNQRYLASKRIREKKKESLKKLETEFFEKTKKEEQEKIKDWDEMSSDEFIQYLMNNDPGNLDVRIIPDDMEKFEGLISPKGDFYSCNFGGHNGKAYYIMIAFYDKFGYSSRNEARLKLQTDKALDKLIESGWIATRYLPSRGSYISYKHDIYFTPTKEQKKTAWDAIVKHDCHVDNTEIIL